MAPITSNPYKKSETNFKKKGKKDAKNRKPVQKSRKEVRKEQRQKKKLGRAMYYERKKKSIGKYVRNPDYTDSNMINQEKQTSETMNVDRQKKAEAKKQQVIKKLAKNREKQRRVHLKQANMQEDKEIKRLEKHLKLNKRKSKTIPKSFVEDGLDYILSFCDKEDRTCMLEMEKQMQGTDLSQEFEEDLNLVIGKDVEKSQMDNISNASLHNDCDDSEEECDADIDIEESEDISDMSDNNSEAEIVQKSKINNIAKSKSQIVDTDKDNVPNKHAMNSDEDMEDNGSSLSASGDDEGHWEDIYGRKRDKHGRVINTSEKYVPPAARASQLASQNSQNDRLSRLKKQLKGLINRLAEHNMHTIANQVEELFMSNSRNDMNEILSTLIIEALVTPVLTPDRLISEHIMLIAILHANVGVEVGAHFLLTLVRKFDNMLKESENVENKEVDNLILMISHLYNFKVYGHKLLYEILEILSSRFKEKDIELILLILKTVGFPLRRDDPIALKNLILTLQQQASSTQSDSSRVKFMLDILMAIKNNNMTKIPQYDPSHIEHLKKIIRNFIRKGNSISPFNILLQDLLHVDERGKWWVVGSAWSGNRDVGKDSETTKNNNNKPMFSEKLLDLARKQRMNTDVRRNIFCVVITAEDYLDAFEKLHHLGLNSQQEREVVYVIIDCCLQEKKFNPYYAVLANKFCDYDRKYQMTMQYTLWDKLKILKNYNTKQLTNLAKFLIHLFIENSLPLSVLKVIEFTELDKPTMRLLRQIILGILLHKCEESCLQVFHRISVSPQLQTFRESLRLFMNHFLLKNINLGSMQQVDSALLKSRVELVDNILISHGAKLIF